MLYYVCFHILVLTVKNIYGKKDNRRNIRRKIRRTRGITHVCGVRNTCNRQGKIRLVKWFDVAQITDKYKYMRDVAVTIIGRSSRLCNFMEWGEYKIIYKRYASLYFITLCDKDENQCADTVH